MSKLFKPGLWSEPLIIIGSPAGSRPRLLLGLPLQTVVDFLFLSTLNQSSSAEEGRYTCTIFLPGETIRCVLMAFVGWSNNFPLVCSLAPNGYEG